MRRIILGSILNFRDLGGYPTADGKTTKWGNFYRSAMPSVLTAEDFQKAHDLNISTVIDLRSPGEIQREQCAFDTDGFEYIHVDLAGSQLHTMMPDAAGTPAGYFSVVKAQKTIADVFHAIAAAKGAVLFHCTAGKDRTGITAAILLMLAGVDNADIVADYQITFTYLRTWVETLKKMYSDIPMHAVVSDPEYMWGFLELFQAEYDSAEAYLRIIGLSDSEISSIKARLI